MTDPSDSLSLAENGDARPTGARDLPPPPPLPQTGRAALFLDFDGTLVDIADSPDSVRVAPGLPALVTALARRLEGRLAIVSGRSLSALQHFLGPLDVAMAGSHGGEFRASGSAAVEPLAAPLPDDVADRMTQFAQTSGGLLVEPKPFSIAIHYRRHPEARDALLACAQAVASDHAMKVKHGKQVVELAMPGSDKGSAVARFMELAPFAGATPLFVGDDVTDEDAFAAVGPLGGAGILVGPMRATAARWRLAGVADVHGWLSAGLDLQTIKGNTPA